MAIINFDGGFIRDSIGIITINGLRPGLSIDEVSNLIMAEINNLRDGLNETDGEERRELREKITRLELLPYTVLMC